MARLACVVIPGHPHHVTQRGNSGARTFFCDADDALYRDLLAENCRTAGVEVWARCLMPNHVHLVLVPSDPDGLRRALDDLRVPPGNRLEALKADSAGQHSIRVNDRYRICFVWPPDGPEDVEFVDYH
jgi:hypothetical protein